MTALKNALKDVFSIDLRALALFRIFLGMSALYKIIDSSFWLESMFSDHGPLPRSIVMDYLQVPFRWSLFYVSGTTVFATLLFIIAFVFCCFLIFGYRTRLSSAVLWVFFLSLNTRNPLINTGGEDLLRTMLFWSMFLPLGAKYALSIGANSTTTSKTSVFNLASAIILLQVSVVYFFTGLLKSHPIWSEDFIAIEIALHHEALVSSFGTWILQTWPSSLLRGMTAIIRYADIILPIAILIPYASKSFVRPLTIAFFMAFHIGLLLCIYINLFQFVSISCWLLFLPSFLLDKIESRILLNKYIQKPLNTITSKAKQFLQFINPYFKYKYSPVANFKLSTRSRYFLIFISLYVFMWNLQSLSPQLKFSEFQKIPGNILYLEQNWSMFAPFPPTVDGWFVVPAKQINGKIVDIKSNKTTDIFERPKSLALSFNGNSWRKYWFQFFLPQNYKHARENLGYYLCRQWNKSHYGSERVISLEVYFMKEQLNPDLTNKPIQKQLLWKQKCSRPMYDTQ